MSHTGRSTPEPSTPSRSGHEDLVRRAAQLFDQVVVAVADSRAKRPFFTLEERVEMARDVLAAYKQCRGARVFRAADGVSCATRRRRLILRGLRAVSDFEYEFQMAGMNRNLYPDVETLFLTPCRAVPCSSPPRMVREISVRSAATSASSSIPDRRSGCLKKAENQPEDCED